MYCHRLLPVLLLSVINPGLILAFEEIVHGQVHPEAMMGSFVPARSSPSASPSLPTLPSSSSILSPGVPRVLYSEQAEKKYQEIMGSYDMTRRSQVQDFNPGGRSTFVRHRQQKRMPKLVVENIPRPVSNSRPEIINSSVKPSIRADQSKMNYNDRMQDDAMMYKKEDMTDDNVGDKFRKVEYKDSSLNQPPIRKIPTRNRRIKLGRGHSRLSQAPKTTTSIHVDDMMEAKDDMMPMIKTKDERPHPKNIQDIIDLQEEVTDEEYYENDAVSRREALKIAQPLPTPQEYQDNRDQANFNSNNSNNNRNTVFRPPPPFTSTQSPYQPPMVSNQHLSQHKQEGPYSSLLKHAPKLVLVNRGEQDQIGPTQDGDNRKSQSYEFKIEDSNLGIPKSGPKSTSNSPFTTVEVDSSVPLELSYVMELIREGFFEDEETGESVFSLDAVV